MSKQSKKFHIGDLLSITSGRLTCPQINGRSHPIIGVHEILSFMSGESLYTHALPRICKEARPILLAEYPWLAEIEVPDVPAEHELSAWEWVCDWLKPIAEEYGEYHEVWPMHQEDHESIEPMDEPSIQHLVDEGNVHEIDPSENDDEPPSEGDINWKVN